MLATFDDHAPAFDYRHRGIMCSDITFCGILVPLSLNPNKTTNNHYIYECCDNPMAPQHSS